MSKICCIVGGVPAENYDFPSDCYIIAADKGYEYLKKQGILPDLAVGDFDSLEFLPTDTPTVRHPVEKDDTDTMLAVREGLNRGYRYFILYGCLGGERIEHSIANLQTLNFIASQGGMGFLVQNDTVITAIQNSKLMFDAKESGDISVFCMGSEAEGVNIKGLHYELTNATLSPYIPLGVSNQFEGKASFVSVKSGSLTIVWRKEIKALIRDIES